MEDKLTVVEIETILSGSLLESTFKVIHSNSIKILHKRISFPNIKPEALKNMAIKESKNLERQGFKVLK